MEPRARAAVELFRRQHGIITRQQATDELAMSRSAVDRRLRSGRWERVGAGVYRHAHHPETWESRVIAACLGLGAIASHRTAARLWELDGIRWGGVELTQSDRSPSGRHRGHVLLHESSQLDLIVPHMRHGIPTTDAARTLLDLAGVLSTDQLDFAFDSLMRRKLATADDLRRTLFAHSVRGRNGIRRFRSLLERRLPDASSLPDSVFNRRVAHAVERAGLGPFEFEYTVRREGRFVARVDLAWPRERVAIEADSIRYHFDHRTFQRDRAKRNELQLLGWHVLAFTWDDYRQRRDFMLRTVREALQSRNSRPEASNIEASGRELRGGMG